MKPTTGKLVSFQKISSVFVCITLAHELDVNEILIFRANWAQTETESVYYR